MASAFFHHLSGLNLKSRLDQDQPPREKWGNALPVSGKIED